MTSVSSQILGYRLPPALRSLVERHQTKRIKTAADRALARRLNDGVARLGAPASGLSFYVHDGAISIYGAVPDAPTRESVIAIVTQTPGVRRVVDHLRIEA